MINSCHNALRSNYLKILKKTKLNFGIMIFVCYLFVNNN